MRQRFQSDVDRVLDFIPTLKESQIIETPLRALGAVLPVHQQFITGCTSYETSFMHHDSNSGRDESKQSANSVIVSMQQNCTNSKDSHIELSPFHETFTGSAEIANDSPSPHLMHLSCEQKIFELHEVVVDTIVRDNAAGVRRIVSRPQKLMNPVSSSSPNLSLHGTTSTSVHCLTSATKLNALLSTRRGKSGLNSQIASSRKPIEPINMIGIRSKLASENEVSISSRSPSRELTLLHADFGADKAHIPGTKTPSISRHSQSRGQTAPEANLDDSFAGRNLGMTAVLDTHCNFNAQSVQLSTLSRRSPVRNIDVPNAPLPRSRSNSRRRVQATDTQAALQSRFDSAGHEILRVIPSVAGDKPSTFSRTPVESHDLTKASLPRERSHSLIRVKAADSQGAVQPQSASFSHEISHETQSSVELPASSASRRIVAAAADDGATEKSDRLGRPARSFKKHASQLRKAAVAASSAWTEKMQSNQYEEC